MTPQANLASAAPVRKNLGTSAKSVVPLAPAILRKRRHERAGMTVTAGSILYDPAKEPADQHRTVWCNRGIKSGREGAGVYRRLDGGGARLSNTVMCGSVWTCPTCSGPIQEQRRRELQAGLVASTSQGLHAYLLTLTFPHNQFEHDPHAGAAENETKFRAYVRDLVLAEDQAVKRFKQSPAWRDLKGHKGAVGSVRGREVTFGQNGPHPHTHTLIFAAPGLLADQAFLDRLRLAWVSAITKAGICPRDKRAWALERAFDLRGGDKAAEYIAKFGHDEKWGMSSELTRHTAKIGLRGGLADFEGHVTPFQVLAWAEQGDATARRLFHAYALAYHGRRQLTWSPGLKKRFGVGDLSDEEITNTPQPEEQCVGMIDDEQLAVLVQRRAVPEFLDWVAEFAACQADIDDIVGIIRTRPPSAKPWITKGGRLLTFPKFEQERNAA